ncbi:lipopolysaccharide biosynthesis protein [Catellatospora citrea]|uniref:O-antigen/teichoic acid export membrane protein n=1 Tax=Catellatospora citrea TaxID=53366 RepID=A0A8J3K8F6_9ACTN|nr:hypothetical protein [Catellatospora citrea]RKE08021.1 O-antigen/teichoic acid export membrane protein [Catellatospora citrea]GIF98402.1 hypothetical protein Cci01nite_34960 [Catellatospora citrea]
MGEAKAASRRNLGVGLALPSARSPLWIAAGGAYSGLTTYVLLVMTARALGPDQYGVFSIFWSTLVLILLGVFLPIEQVLAFRRAGGKSVDGLLGSGIRMGLIYTGVCVAAVAAFQLVVDGGGIALSVLVAITLGVAGSALQSPARGMLSGQLDLRGYAAVISIDGTGRTVGVIVLWAIGTRQAAPYMICVGASALLAGIVGVWLVRRGGEAARTEGHAGDSPGGLRSIWREVSGLVVALLCMQALLNSPVLVAGAFAGDAAFTGLLMAIVSAARLPVFLAQAGQATYVGRIATAHHRHDLHAVRRLMTLVAGVVGALALLTVLGAAALGPQLVHLVFGSGYVVDRLTCILVAAGVGLYLIASVANDISVAVGAHGRAAPIWFLAAVAGVVPALLLNDMVLRSTLPMLIGSAVAAAVLVPRILRNLKWDGA